MLLTPAEVVERYRGVVSVRTLANWRSQGVGPKWLKIGKAGLTKEIRDRLQNHAMQDVSSKSYDRYNYMPEKRAAMEAWDQYVRKMLSC